MDGREEEYQLAGPYLYTRRVFVVKKDSDIRELSDLVGKTIALQAGLTSENIILRESDPDIPELTDIGGSVYESQEGICRCHCRT